MRRRTVCPCNAGLRRLDDTRAGADQSSTGPSRDVTIVEAHAQAGGRVGMHAHPGDEHHLVLSGRLRMSQGEHSLELGPGDYLRWDGSVPHDAEAIGDDDAALLIVRIRPRD